ncbi:MAG TPA: succinylglutamate desuccinylase [Aeromonadales bacterium]|nr:succinylglutamate desuccinylase [Aeromonadales bacterium]
MWQQICNDFLSYTLESFSHDTVLPAGTYVKKFPGFTASWMGEGMLSFVPHNDAGNNYESNKVLIVSVAIHGNETAPLELANQWIKQIFLSELKPGLPVFFIIGNIEAILSGQRFIELNLNRLFNEQTRLINEQDAEIKSEQQRAKFIMCQLEKFTAKFSQASFIHFDLHTAIRKSLHEKFLVLPFNDHQTSSEKLLQFWSDAGLTAALQSHAPASTFSYYTRSNLNAISATVELGQVAALGENDLSRLTLTDQAVKALITAADWPKLSHQSMLTLFQVKDEIIKTSDKFKLNIGEDVANFTHFQKGFKLAEDISSGYEYIIQSEKDVIVFPNTKVPVGQRVALIAE